MSDFDWHDTKHKIYNVIADNEVRNTRISLCEACENLSSVKVCGVCNCFMPVKTWLKTKVCPIGKW